MTCFTQTLAREGEARAWRLANLVLHALLVVVGAIVVLGMVFSPWLVTLIAPGFAEIPGKSELTAQLTRLMFPFLLLVALAAVAMGMLNARGPFRGSCFGIELLQPRLHRGRDRRGLVARAGLHGWCLGGR